MTFLTYNILLFIHNVVTANPMCTHIFLVQASFNATKFFNVGCKKTIASPNGILSLGCIAYYAQHLSDWNIMSLP